MAVGGRRWAWLAVLLVGVALVLLVLVALIGTRNVLLVPVLIVLGAAVVPAAFLTFVQGRSGQWQVPGSVVTVAALLGGLIGVIAAAAIEYDTLRRLGALPAVLIGLTEETAKLVVPALILLLWRRRPRSPGDGLVIGVASGAGFAALETMGYAFTALLASSGNLGTVEQILLARGLTAAVVHPSWTGVAAGALFALAAGPSAGRWLAFAVTLLAVVALHASWDAAGSPLAYAVIALVSLGWLLWQLHRHRRPTVPTPEPGGAA
ncbi:PrsW family intramembrane metalloprotease [Micromonospora zingiberis]|uniref:PrsW family intramembrane metalloprotease n=1 Tax=Micromonospora zingiberis TaxID=2053011 RepID=A0A4R0GVY5_9ACTN|nr:PrsW family glutamic-type intramembrane protease [Micromonospora zingiberis]TCC00160.1 PrsW family intramembrane metalloprotease [Micromonospora zingiberis]